MTTQTTTPQAVSLQLQSMTPILTTEDISASLAWYRDILGFEVRETFPPEGELQGARLANGDVEVLLTQDDFAKGRDRLKGEGLRLYCATDKDIDALAAAIQASGGKLAQEPTDQAWGARDFAVIDPDGFKISISSGM